MNNKTQMALDYMKAHGSITTLEAWEQHGNSRLSDTIWRLKKQGIGIKAIPIEVKDRYGNTCHVARYMLTEEKSA